MALSIEQIRTSGMLELYVLGDLSPHDMSEVSAALAFYPELRNDLMEIEQAFEVYAKANAIDTPNNLFDGIKGKLDTSTGSSASSKGSNNGLTWGLGLLMAASLAALFYLWSNLASQQNTNQQLQNEIAQCKEKDANQQQEIALLNQISDPNNEIFTVNATDKYPQTKLLFYKNDVSKVNFVQVQTLPDINPNQSFQLWSLKGDNAPIPLDVFDAGGRQFIQVRHVDNTDAYAITIEPKGGSQTPNLDDLIGVFPMSS